MAQNPLAHLALSENGFLFDTTTGNTYTLNKTGTFILKLLIEGAPNERLAEEVVKRFETSPEIAVRDLELFVVRLVDLGITDRSDDEWFRENLNSPSSNDRSENACGAGVNSNARRKEEP